jgi:rubrerythrin
VKAAGGKPSTVTPRIEYPQLKSEADILGFAEKLERGAASLYVTEIGRLSNAHLSKLLASILGVETMHVSILASALKQERPYAGFIT